MCNVSAFAVNTTDFPWVFAFKKDDIRECSKAVGRIVEKNESQYLYSLVAKGVCGVFEKNTKYYMVDYGMLTSKIRIIYSKSDSGFNSMMYKMYGGSSVVGYVDTEVCCKSYSPHK